MHVIGFHTQHDANFAIAVDGELVLCLELERIFEERYFSSAYEIEPFRKQWQDAIRYALEYVKINEFDIAVTSWVMPRYRRILMDLVKAKKWITVDHHVAHCWAGMADSPFSSALVFSYDGGGNDGTFNVYLVNDQKCSSIARIPLNLGTPYRALAMSMPEVTHHQPQPRSGHLSLAGKLMAYASLGRPRAEWIPALRQYYELFITPSQAIYSLGEQIALELDPDALEPTTARDLAATSQTVFEALLLENIERQLMQYDFVEGVILVGGGALNVVANEHVQRSVSKPIHVPSIPNDCGIAVGAVNAVEPFTTSPSVFSGLPLINDVSDYEMLQAGARPVSIDILAGLLLDGAVIGVARGRSEMGPRALGNRSIFAYPADPHLKDRINSRIKFREWYRPLAPVVPIEHVNEFLQRACYSPYMSFAPDLNPDAVKRFPAISHIDSTARVQTLSRSDHPWLYSLLMELHHMGGAPILLNTSFNSRGKPLLQRKSTALELLQMTDLDYVVIDEWLISKQK